MEDGVRVSSVTGSEFIFDNNLPTLVQMEDHINNILLDRKYHPDAVSYSPIRAQPTLVDPIVVEPLKASFHETAETEIADENTSLGNNSNSLSSNGKDHSLKSLSTNVPQSSWFERRNRSASKNIPELRQPESHFVKKSFIFSGSRSVDNLKMLPRSLGGSGILQQTEQRALSFRERMQRRK
jgi:hypothetical protein